MGIEEKTKEGILLEEVDMTTYISIREHEGSFEKKYMSEIYYPYEGGIRKIGE